MSEDRSSNGQKSWLGKLTQAFAHEPKNRQELLELLREAHQNKLLDSEALAIVEGHVQALDGERPSRSDARIEPGAA